MRRRDLSVYGRRRTYSVELTAAVKWTPAGRPAGRTLTSPRTRLSFRCLWGPASGGAGSISGPGCDRFRSTSVASLIRGCSSAGRALHSHCRGQGFDPPQLHLHDNRCARRRSVGRRVPMTAREATLMRRPHSKVRPLAHQDEADVLSAWGGRQAGTNE